MDRVYMEHFSAVWCGPCRNMLPVIAELKAAGWDIRKVDIDQEPERARAAGVMGVPTFIIYNGDKVVSRFTGAKPKFEIESQLRMAASK